MLGFNECIKFVNDVIKQHSTYEHNEYIMTSDENINGEQFIKFINQLFNKHFDQTNNIEYPTIEQQYKIFITNEIYKRLMLPDILMFDIHFFDNTFYRVLLTDCPKHVQSFINCLYCNEYDYDLISFMQRKGPYSYNKENLQDIINDEQLTIIAIKYVNILFYARIAGSMCSTMCVCLDIMSLYFTIMSKYGHDVFNDNIDNIFIIFKQIFDIDSCIIYKYLCNKYEIKPNSAIIERINQTNLINEEFYTRCKLGYMLIIDLYIEDNKKFKDDLIKLTTEIIHCSSIYDNFDIIDIVCSYGRLNVESWEIILDILDCKFDHDKVIDRCLSIILIYNRVSYLCISLLTNSEIININNNIERLLKMCDIQYIRAIHDNELTK